MGLYVCMYVCVCASTQLMHTDNCGCLLLNKLMLECIRFLVISKAGGGGVGSDYGVTAEMMRVYMYEYMYVCMVLFSCCRLRLVFVC